MSLIRTRFILAFLCILSVSDLFGQVEIGIYGGPSMLKITGDKPGYSVYKPGTGFFTGIVLDFPLSGDVLLSLQPGYSMEHARLRIADTLSFYFVNKLEYKDSINYRLNSANIPVLIKVFSDNHRFQFTSGLEFIYMFSIMVDNGAGYYNADQEHKKYNVAAHFGIGYIIPIKSSHLSMNLQYMQSLTNWSENDPESSFIPRIKTSGLRFVLAWSIPVSSKNRLEP